MQIFVVCTLISESSICASIRSSPCFLYQLPRHLSAVELYYVPYMMLSKHNDLELLLSIHIYKVNGIFFRTVLTGSLVFHGLDNWELCTIRFSAFRYENLY